MNITIVTASPKKSFSNSFYFSRVLKTWLMGNKTTIINLKSAKQHNDLLAKLPETDALVFAFPIYVDAIPSSLLAHLEKLEGEIAGMGLKCKVYGITNCGFYEGSQCRLGMKMLGNWSARAGLEWGGGIGIGAGEMVGIMRIVPPIGLGAMLLQVIIASIVMAAKGVFSFENLAPYVSFSGVLISCLVYLVFSFGLFMGMTKLRRAIVRRTYCPETWPIFLCPRFLFIFFADAFWVLRGLFHGVMPWKLFRKLDDNSVGSR